jgi:Na+-driven multidrug efflux pump
LKPANNISIFNKKVYSNIKEYLTIGIPNMIVLILDWTCFEISSIMAGLLGVNEQAVNIILLNLTTLAF